MLEACTYLQACILCITPYDVQVVCHSHPLAPSLWKTLLKLLNSNMFPANAALIAAIAHCEGDTWQPKGAVQAGQQALQPHLSLLIGSSQAGTTTR